MQTLLAVSLARFGEAVVSDISGVSGTHDSVLRRSYTQQSPVQPRFETPITGYNMVFSGQNQTIHNLYLGYTSFNRAIFGYCYKAQIKDLVISNFKFTIQDSKATEMSILCANMQDTILQNVNVSINSVVSNYDNVGLVGSQIRGSTIVNVTLSGRIHLDGSRVASLVAHSMSGTTVSQLMFLVNVSANLTGVGLCLVNQVENSSLSEVEVKNSVVLNASSNYSFLFGTASSATLKNVIVYQNLSSRVTSQLYLVCRTCSGVRLNQTQFLVNLGQTQALAVTQTAPLTEVVNSLYHVPMTIQGNSQLTRVTETTIATEYAKFDKTGLVDNTRGYLELAVMYENMHYIEDRTLCGADRCGDERQCQVYQQEMQNLVTIRYMRCICSEGKAGDFCERCVSPQQVMNTTTWECEQSPDLRCLKYGGYDHVKGACRKCDKGYAGQFCNQCIANTSFVTATPINGACKIKCTNGVNGVCHVCQEGYQGDYCQECAFNYIRDTTNQTKCVIDPVVQCAYHNGLNDAKNGCKQCQQNHTGSFCNTCTSGYKYIEFLCRPDKSNQCQIPQDFDFINQKCRKCPKDKTGDLCEKCAPNYVINTSNNNRCDPDPNEICRENGGYNSSESKCNKCQQGFTGNFCDDLLDECCNDSTRCNGFTANLTVCKQSYHRFCVNHGGLNSLQDGCQSCQPGYTGQFCQQCDTNYIRLNGSCAPNFASGNFPHCVRFDRYQCLECERGHYGYTCNECLLGYKYDNTNDICYPVNVLQDQPCYHHGGSRSENNHCVLCFTGYTGDKCASCAGGYISFGGQCIYNYSTECAAHGGYDPRAHACAACTDGFSGRFCAVCASDTVVGGVCVALQQAAPAPGGLIAALVILLLLCVVLAVLIAVYAIRRRREQCPRTSGVHGSASEERQLVERAQINTPPAGATRGGPAVAQAVEQREASQLYDSDGEGPDAAGPQPIDLDARPRATVRPRRFRMSTDLRNITVDGRK